MYIYEFLVERGWLWLMVSVCAHVVFWDKEIGPLLLLHLSFVFSLKGKLLLWQPANQVNRLQDVQRPWQLPNTPSLNTQWKKKKANQIKSSIPIHVNGKAPSSLSKNSRLFLFNSITIQFTLLIYMWTCYLYYYTKTVLPLLH